MEDSSGGLRYLNATTSTRIDPGAAVPPPGSPGVGMDSRPKDEHDGPMNHEDQIEIFAFPAAQEQDRLQFALQGLGPLRRHLRGHSRDRFESLIQHALKCLPAYSSLKHLSPIEFLLIGFILGLLEELEGDWGSDHPPFP